MMSTDKIKRKCRKKSSIRRSSCVPNCPIVPWEPPKDLQELSPRVFQKCNVFDNYHHKAPESKQIAEYKSSKPYKLKIVKFQTTEIIEGLGSLSLIDHQSQPDSNIKVVRKSRHSPESGPRIKMIDDKDTPTNRLTLGVIFDNWAKMANFGLPAEAGDSYLIRESYSEPIQSKKSISGGDKISNNESNTKKRKRSSFNKKATVASLVKDDYHPSYKDTVASKMRYEFRRNKKVCPYYIIQHVMKYQRPPFWNYTKMGKGFNSFLTREQLRKICDI